MNYLASYYANLLPMQYIGKDKAYATIEGIISPFLMDQLPVSVQDAYDLATAIGAQLDTLGKYIGISRSGNTFSGPIVLSDAQYREVLTLMAAFNYLGAQQSAIQDFIHTYFDGVIQEYDTQTMGINYTYLAPIGENLIAEFFIKQGLLPRPLGVEMAMVTLGNPVSTFFGMSMGLTVLHSGSYFVTPPDITGFNDYTAYDSDGHWLSYLNGFKP